MLSHCRRLLLHSCVLVGSILVAAVMSWIFSRGPWVAVAIAGGVVVVALVPPLWFEFWLGWSVAAPTAAVAWRLGVLLPAVLLSTSQPDPIRKCFQYTLLACYFIALPLESWLLARHSRPLHTSRT